MGKKVESAAASTPSRRLSQMDVLGLGVNCVIGSGVFLLPGLAAENLGPASTVAVLAAGVLAGLIALCFAEVSSRFDSSGGAYVYARAAFGRFVGFEVGWLAALAGVIAWGALVNGWSVALSRLVPAVGEGTPKIGAILGLVLVLGLVNALGAKPGAWMSNLFTAAKLTTIAVFIVAGIAAIQMERFEPFAPQGFGALPQSVLLFLYAYVGFENLVVPAGEMRNPRRALPLAVVTIMATVTVLYVLVQSVAVGTVAELEGLRNAVAAAAEGFLGPRGGVFISLTVLISIIGVNSASSLILPRRFSALADDGDLPAVLGRQHPRWGTPVAGIVVSHLLVALIALTGSFRELALMAVIARLMQYMPSCLAVLVFRRRDADSSSNSVNPAAFRLPFGPTIPLCALALCVWLLTTAEVPQLAAGLGGGGGCSGLPSYATLPSTIEPLTVSRREKARSALRLPLPRSQLRQPSNWPTRERAGVRANPRASPSSGSRQSVHPHPGPLPRKGEGVGPACRPQTSGTVAVSNHFRPAVQRFFAKGLPGSP